MAVLVGELVGVVVGRIGWSIGRVGVFESGTGEVVGELVGVFVGELVGVLVGVRVGVFVMPVFVGELVGVFCGSVSLR